MARGRGNSRRARPYPVARSLGLFKARITGHSNKLTGQAAPPINEKIYYQQVIRFEVSQGTNFTPASICQAVAQQIFPAAVAGDTDLLSSLVIKLERMDVWATSVGPATTRPSCTLTVNSTDANASSAGTVLPYLKEIKDIGSLSHAARCSYTWPLDMVETPLSFLSDATVASVVFNTPSAEVRFHLRWSPITSLVE